MLVPKLKIEVLATSKGCLSTFSSEHLLFSVQGGSGKLHMAWFASAEKSSPYEPYSRSALYLDDTPLIQIQSSGCPTCESLLAAGYGLPKYSAELHAVRERMTEPYAGLTNALERIRPVLGLLLPGIYILSYSDYYPTDGDGHFYWDIPETFTSYKATAQYYNTGNYRVLPCFPCFLYPTQSAEKYNPQRVEEYRGRLRMGQSLPPVLTYSLWESMSVLLDGHHRACACALEGQKTPALTISRPGLIRRENILNIVWPDGGETPAEACFNPQLLPLLEKPFAVKYTKAPPAASSILFRRAWETPYMEAARIYPSHMEAGTLALYPNIQLNAEGLRLLAMDDDYEDAVSAARLLGYAARQPGADVKKLCMAFIEPGYPAVLRRRAFEILDRIKEDPEIDDLMVSILVNCECRDDPIYQLANSHWEPSVTK